MPGTGWGLSNWLGDGGREGLGASTKDSSSSKEGVGQGIVGDGQVLVIPESYFVSVSTEAQRGEGTCPKSHSG